MQSHWLGQWVKDAKIEVATLLEIYAGFYRWLRGNKPKAECLPDRRLFEQRTRSALMHMRRMGEAALIGRAKYRFFV